MQLDWPKIRRKVLSFCRWMLLAWIYLGLIATDLRINSSLLPTGVKKIFRVPAEQKSNGDGSQFYVTATDESEPSEVRAKVIGSAVFRWCVLGLIFAIVLTRLREERRLVGGGSDQFRGGNLFFRYGVRDFHGMFSTNFSRSWSAAKVEAFVDFLQGQLAQHVGEKLPAGIEITPSLPVKNLSTGSEKKFVRILARTSRGSLVSHFVHLETIGHALTVHYFTYSRGLEKPSEVLRFVLESPVRIWFWFLPHALSRYSILTRVSSFEDDSFDLIELQTRYQTITALLQQETLAVFREAGLLTPELNQTIVNIFSAAQATFGSNSPINTVTHSPNSTIQQAAELLVGKAL